ncbi:hypothetical protein KFL_002830210 [Klebsormidium nitens]|uniref:Uncharacterized protein n=1 Tax=Klebsormidium nitens TaxID=105231 RepID=A0A1Y1I5V4_KLENI|nr:hypothetical protein KFL_002830210 [Klebsormidium nitens]|eukprot:GAQ86344.1 hypothetical protein KFL_002830210 [Klebsormidium nitens]
MDRYKSQGKRRLGQVAAPYEESSPLHGLQTFSYGFGACDKGRTLDATQHSDDSIYRPDSSYRATSGAEAPSSGLANIDSFGVATAPYVPIHQTFKSCLEDGAYRIPLQHWGASQAAPPPFLLSDLWASLEEASAYGAGVPIVINGDEDVVQYYVPYLSAIELWRYPDRRKELNVQTPDGSDSDIREASSDGADSDSDQSESAAVLLELDRESFRGAIGGGAGSTRSSHDALSVCSGSAGSMYLEEESPRHHSSRGPWGSQNVCPDRQQGNRLFEYAENAPPFLRVPLADKVAELAKKSPCLMSMSSQDLHPSSWVSIAWYPIYRIPMGKTLRDLGACFLTYHSLATPRLGTPPSDCSCIPAASQGIASCQAWPPAPPVLTPAAADAREEREEMLQAQSSSGGQQHVLLPFGMVAYKMKGAVWSSGRGGKLATSMNEEVMREAARSWLDKRNIHHPDFEFFLKQLSTPLNTLPHSRR